MLMQRGAKITFQNFSAIIPSLFGRTCVVVQNFCHALFIAESGDCPLYILYVFSGLTSLLSFFDVALIYDKNLHDHMSTLFRVRCFMYYIVCSFDPPPLCLIRPKPSCLGWLVRKVAVEFGYGWRIRMLR